MYSRSFSILIFLPGGNSDGVKVIDKSNWPGRALVVPRSLFPEVKKREEFTAPGVYILVGPSAEGDLPTI